MLAEELARFEGHPWAEWKASKNASPKPLTKHQLARLLHGFHVTPDTVKIGTQSLKGYYRHQFEEVWTRYLTPEGESDPSPRNQPTDAGTSAAFQNVTEESQLRVENSEKPLGHNDGYAVTFQNGGIGTSATNEGPWPSVCEHCGNPEEPGNPVHPYDKDGQTYQLHPACWVEWLREPASDNAPEAQP